MVFVSHTHAAAAHPRSCGVQPLQARPFVPQGKLHKNPRQKKLPEATLT